jgi:hypothetical protein
MNWRRIKLRIKCFLFGHFRSYGEKFFAEGSQFEEMGCYRCGHNWLRKI